MLNAIRSLRTEPRAPNPPGPSPRDWILVGLVTGSALVEGALRPDLTWRPVAIVVAVAVAFLLPWRRTHPLVVELTGFGTVVVLDIAVLATSSAPVGLYSMAYLLLLPYALTRWASGRDLLIGVPFLIAPVVFGLWMEWTGVGDAVGAVAVVLTSLALGAAVRNRANAHTRQLEQMKMLEREQLARELHDTVAHHVSAIIIQAQAGRTLAPAQPEAAVAALEAIESAAAETLSDMRAMVRILRHGEAELAPLGGVADITALAARAGSNPPIAVELAGDVGGLAPAVDAAVYRLVQESITNALRHARGATQVVVRVAHDGEGQLHLRVHDDGDTTHLGPPRPGGYGLVGMAERARLLGGTCTAGVDPEGGWTVSAVLPAPRPAMVP